MKSQTYITVSLLSPSSAGDQIQGLAYTGQVFSPLSHFLCPQKIIPGFYNAQFFFLRKGNFVFQYWVWAQCHMSLSGKDSDINTPASEDYICFFFFHFKNLSLCRMHAHVCSGTHAQMWRPPCHLETGSLAEWVDH